MFKLVVIEIIVRNIGCIKKENNHSTNHEKKMSGTPSALGPGELGDCKSERNETRVKVEKRGEKLLTMAL